jgi:transcriptional regulator with XRE-family HTH domain
MEDIARTLGANLRKARSRQGLTQAQLAELIDLPVELYARMERGALLPSMHLFVKLCRLLDVTAGQLLGMSRPRFQSVRRSSE